MFDCYVSGEGACSSLVIDWNYGLLTEDKYDELLLWFGITNFTLHSCEFTCVN